MSSVLVMLQHDRPNYSFEGVDAYAIWLKEVDIGTFTRGLRSSVILQWFK